MNRYRALRLTQCIFLFDSCSRIFLRNKIMLLLSLLFIFFDFCASDSCTLAISCVKAILFSALLTRATPSPCALIALHSKYKSTLSVYTHVRVSILRWRSYFREHGDKTPTAEIDESDVKITLSLPTLPLADNLKHFGWLLKFILKSTPPACPVYTR